MSDSLIHLNDSFKTLIHPGMNKWLAACEYAYWMWAVGEKYPYDLLLPVRFGYVQSMDILLSHEATGQDLWMEVKQNHMSHDNDNMVYVVHPNFIHTTHIHRNSSWTSHWIISSTDSFCVVWRCATLISALTLWFWK